jgi:hypothetical protein
MRMLGLPELLVILFVGFAMLLAVLWPYSKIFSKAGYSGALALLMLIPGVNLAVLFWFAFAEWPALRRGSAGDRQ